MKYGNRIKYVRKQQGLLQIQLGKMIGLADSSAIAVISQYERNIKKPRLHTQKALANALGVDYRLLFSNHDNSLVNIYIDLYWLLLEGNNVIYLSYLLDNIKKEDKINFPLFEQLIK